MDNLTLLSYAYAFVTHPAFVAIVILGLAVAAADWSLSRRKLTGKKHD